MSGSRFFPGCGQGRQGARPPLRAPVIGSDHRDMVLQVGQQFVQKDIAIAGQLCLAHAVNAAHFIQ